VYLWDADGTRVTGLDTASAVAVRLATVMAERQDGADSVDELRTLLEDHRAAGSLLARRLLENKAKLGDQFWLIEPVAAPVGAEPARQTAPRRVPGEAGAVVVR